MAESGSIDEELRRGIELTGATPWILIFAIMVAAVGLNVNSTAVIIGAMLISPLMGPIMGIGYGVGIYDFALIRRAFLNLGIATLIGLTTSSIYFALTPLTEAQSELLSRTTPTIWDVLIATFGGLAGIVGATRQVKTTVIPGVAIATALMPPLCTAGYGLANLNRPMFLGAFYLFSINCVFIAAATVAIVWLLRLPRHKFVDHRTEVRIKRWLMIVVVLTALPSLYLAYQLVRTEVFKEDARQFVRKEFQFKQTHVIETDIVPAERRIVVTLIGEHLDQPALKQIEGHLQDSGLAGVTVVVHQSDDNQIDVTSLKAGLLKDLYRDSQVALDERDHKIEQLQQALVAGTNWQKLAPDIAVELEAQYPGIHDVLIGEGIMTGQDPKEPATQVSILSAKSAKPLSGEDRKRIEDWFRIRTKASSVRLFLEAPPVPPSPVKDKLAARKRH